MWEYKTALADALPNEANLNELGREGWEMIQIVKHELGFVLYLKRPVSN